MLELLVRVVLVVLVLGGGFVAWRNASSRGLTARGGPVLRVVGRAGLTRSSLVAVVDVDGRRYLVGAAEQGVNLLAALGESPAEPAGADDELDGTPADVDGGPSRVRRRGPGAPVTTDRDLEAAHAVPTTRPTTLGAVVGAALGAHGRGTATRPDGPRIGPLDRLRGMTVRSHVREPIRVNSSDVD